MGEYDRRQQKQESRAIANQKAVKFTSQLMKSGSKGDYKKDRASLSKLLSIEDKGHHVHGKNFDPVPKFEKLDEKDGLMYIAKNLIEPTKKTDDDAEKAVVQL